MNRESGQATAVVMGVAALVLVTIVGLGIYAYRNPPLGRDYEAPGKPRPSNNLGSISTSTTGSTISIATSTKPSATEGRAQPKPVAAASQAVSGPAYHNPTFGLTVPGSYNVAQRQNVYGGVPTTASYDFYTGGVYAFTINVFSKEQWNNIRIQETRNMKEGTGPDYLGEGRYLGENQTWIYSIIYGSYQPSKVRFY